MENVVRIVPGLHRPEARQVRLLDEIPLGTQLVKASPSAAAVDGRLEWEFGTLAPGESKSVEIELLPVDEGEIGSVATVHFAASASARTQSTRPRLEVIAAVEPTVMIGAQQVVRITLKNPGSGDATGVMLLENVPDGMSHPHGPNLEFEVGTLRAGESRELELVLTALRTQLPDLFTFEQLVGCRMFRHVESPAQAARGILNYLRLRTKVRQSGRTFRFVD